MQPLAVTAYSLVNALGSGAAATAAALRAGRSGLAPCRFADVDLDTYVGEVSGLDEVRMRADLIAYDSRNNRLAQLALRVDDFEARAAAARERYGAHRVGVFMGTSTSGILETELAYRRRDAASGALPADFRYAETQNNFSLADFVQRYLALAGPAFVVSSACSSSAKVFGNAARMIAAGVCDAAVVGGVDSLCLTTLYGFNSLGLVSREPCRPYDLNRDGISIGEGAGFALLERRESASGTPTLLVGLGESSDAHHMSTPHPEGAGAQLAMRKALATAALTPADIGYINVHGTATRSNDASEDHAIVAVFGTDTPCSSTKGQTGHLLGAAGVTEGLISLLALEMQIIPGSVHTRTRDPALRCGYRVTTEAARFRHALTNSFGFGGSNCSLLFSQGA